MVDNNNAEILKAKLEDLNKLSPDELKQRYLEIMSSSGLSEKGGAGLGLIEMMRKSGNKLAYDFRSINDSSSYFYFQSHITTAENTNPADAKGMLNTVKEIHDFSNLNHISLIYQGIFAQGNLKNILSITEGGVAPGDPLSFRKKAVNVMIELLQNIIYHAANPDNFKEGKPGILLVNTEGEDCFVSAGNYVLNSDKVNIVTKLERVNALDQGGLEQLYKEKILKEDNPDSKGADLGFIDLRLKTGNRIEYCITDMDNKFSFLSVQIKING